LAPGRRLAAAGTYFRQSSGRPQSSVTDNKHCPNCAALEAKLQHMTSQLMQFDKHYALKEALPSHDEAAQLFEKITSKYKQMRVPGEEHEQIEGLRCGMAYLFGSCARAETPNARYDASWWLGNCRDWLSAARMYGRVRSMVLCVVATNSIPYLLDNSLLYISIRSAAVRLSIATAGNFSCAAIRCPSRTRR
jgi:hypothetical protein